MENFDQQVWAYVKGIPRGEVATYATVARKIGHPRSARAVGNALNRNPYRDVPCHRVIRSDGRAGGFARGIQEKIKLLRSEGVKINNRRIDLGQFSEALPPISEARPLKPPK